MWEQMLEMYGESRINEGSPECLFAETLIFNEGWLLRSVLKEWKARSRSSRLPFLPFPADAKVYSEGQLRTPFKAHFQGDPLAESHTHVDGIAGHFSIAACTKSGIELAPECGYTAVFEAKIYSPISKGVKRASGYDQVSRIAACLIHALLEAGLGEGFQAHVVVLYPGDNLAIKPEEFEKVQIRERIGQRLAGYRAGGDPTRELAGFAADWEAVFEQLHIGFVTWEEVLAEIGDDGLNRFYELCQRFGR